MSDLSFDQKALREVIDRDAIFDLVRLERFWRDRCEWDRLLAAYTEPAVVRVSWFEGSAREFVAGSRKMHERGGQSRHVILPTYLRIEGDRALAESVGQVHIRGKLEGVEYDLIAYCRFVSRVVRTAAGWRFATFEAIYDHDALAPVNPSDRLAIDAHQLATMRPAYRFLAYTLAAAGYKVNPDLPGDDRPESLAPLYEAAERWLKTGK
jgi:SnoaL-like domain